jgi:hypothetical protein
MMRTVGGPQPCKKGMWVRILHIAFHIAISNFLSLDTSEDSLIMFRCDEAFEDHLKPFALVPPLAVATGAKEDSTESVSVLRQGCISNINSLGWWGADHRMCPHGDGMVDCGPFKWAGPT